MTRLLLIVATLLLAGCNTGNRDETDEDAEYAPIGPGSDSSTLIPPDTPESRQGETTPRQGSPPRDSL